MDAHITDTLVFWLAVVGACWLIVAVAVGVLAIAMCRAGKREDERLAAAVNRERSRYMKGEAA